MARGWESKDVESQVEEIERAPAKSPANSKSPEQLHTEQTRNDLHLSRIRIAHDLESATHPNHKKSLQAALDHLDKKIADLS